MLRRIKHPVLLGALIVVLLSLGTAGAAKLITGKDIADRSITGKDIKKGSIPLSALKGKPAGNPGPQGERGPKGDAGVVGATGSSGTSSLVRVGTLTGPIQASIAPSSSLKFVGTPAEVDLAESYRGVVEATVTIGTGETIDDTEKFALAICVDQGSGPETIEGDESEPFGVSPKIESGDRVSIAVSSGFFVNGGGEELFTVLMGPCVLNETTSALDDNDRTVGYVLASFPAL